MNDLIVRAESLMHEQNIISVEESFYIKDNRQLKKQCKSRVGMWSLNYKLTYERSIQNSAIGGVGIVLSWSEIS